MTSSNIEYWPFAETSQGNALPAEALSFLEQAWNNGYASFRSGIDIHGARFEDREGCILERGRKRWEVRLAENGRPELAMYVEDFVAAGLSVEQWLHGAGVEEIKKNVETRLITRGEEETL